MSAPIQKRDREIAAWFREVAMMDDTERDWLFVNLTDEQCLEVARVIEGGLSMFTCDPDETDGAER